MGERGFESERVDTARMREREALSGLEMVNWGFVSPFSNLIWLGMELRTGWLLRKIWKA